MRYAHMSGGVYEVYYYSWYKFHRITPDLVLELNLGAPNSVCLAGGGPETHM